MRPLPAVFRAGIRAHRLLFTATGGRVGSFVPGMRFLLLRTVGRKSGDTRETPLTYIPDGGRFVVIASRGGSPRHPAWYLNLEADPRAEVRIGTRTHLVRARTASPEERERLWPRVVAKHSLYAGYQERTDREIPVVLLEPDEG